VPVKGPGGVNGAEAGTGSGRPAIGHPSVVKQVRSVLFSEVILGAASVKPLGYNWSVLALMLGWFAPLLSRRATDPLPPSLLYLAVTEADIRLFGKPSFSNLFEIGRWKTGSYRAWVRRSAFGLKLELDLERLGRVTLVAGRSAAPVFDLVVQGART
jgi:hypothetical protein